ncbi:hypothetical protein GF357_02025 [Candidatus Dojkabacteria bacterium]|nr:hypothetical protein [Candidatus Dojkabacteria bacterium]
MPLASKNLPQSINLLDPVLEPEDIWTKAYNWIVNIGRVLLVFVEIIVLAVFYIRYTYDKVKNDLTEDINRKILSVLSLPENRRDERKFRSYLNLIDDIKLVQDNQKLNSDRLAIILDTLPQEFELQTISFVGNRVSLSLLSRDFDSISAYTADLKENPLIDENVKVSLSKEAEEEDFYSTDIEFTVSFKFITSEE